VPSKKAVKTYADAGDALAIPKTAIVTSVTGASDTNVPSEKAVKTYTDARDALAIPKTAIVTTITGVSNTNVPSELAVKNYVTGVSVPIDNSATGIISTSLDTRVPSTKSCFDNIVRKVGLNEYLIGSGALDLTPIWNQKNNISFVTVHTESVYGWFTGQNRMAFWKVTPYTVYSIKARAVYNFNGFITLAERTMSFSVNNIHEISGPYFYDDKFGSFSEPLKPTISSYQTYDSVTPSNSTISLSQEFVAGTTDRANCKVTWSLMAVKSTAE